MMVYDPDLLDAIESLPRRDHVGTVWRHMLGDSPPERANTRGARWNPPGTAAIYVSLDCDTVVAEGDHLIAVQPRLTRAKRVVYELRVELLGLVDLTAPRALEQVGLTRADVGNDDHASCQEVGGAAAWLGVAGLVVPSARGSGSNIVIMVNDLDPDALFERGSEEVISPGHA